MLPRFFIASARSTPRPPDRDAPAAIDDVVAVVRLGARELVIGTDHGGRLRAVDASARRALPTRAQAQLAFHEVASNQTLTLDAGELYLFDLQMVELLRDAPGLDDPLYLYGALRGPYPDALDAETAAVDGQLTVSRADLLGGLVDGTGRAFRYERSAGGARCIHALLAGEPADAIDRGRGLILAFPLAPTSLMGGAANDAMAAQIFYDVLGALRADLGATGPLPVPNRRALEEKLRLDGWQIDGDTASRRDRGRGMVAAMLGRGEERRALPAQATLEAYAAEAAALLGRLGAPTPTSAAIRRRMATGIDARPSPPPRAPAPAPPASPPPTSPPPTSPLATSPPPSAAPRPAVATPPSEWIRDFVDAHRAPDRPAPALKRPARAMDPDAEPDWMDDFADVPEVSDDAAPEVVTPEWSKDFD